MLLVIIQYNLLRNSETKILTYCTKCSRTPIIRISLDGELSGYADNPDNWIFLWKQAALAIWIKAFPIYSMYLRLNLSTTPDF